MTARASRRALLGTATLGLLGVAGCGVPTVAPDAAADLPRRVVAAWEAGDRTGFVAALGGDACALNGRGGATSSGGRGWPCGSAWR